MCSYTQDLRGLQDAVKSLEAQAKKNEEAARRVPGLEAQVSYTLMHCNLAGLTLRAAGAREEHRGRSEGMMRLVACFVLRLSSCGCLCALMRTSAGLCIVEAYNVR